MEAFFCFNMTIKNQLIVVLLVPCVLVLCFLIFEPGLSGVFLVDDKPHLAELNRNGGIDSFVDARYFVFNGSSGLFGRPVSMLSLLIEDQFYPGAVAAYRYTNVMFHLLAGVFILLFTQMLFIRHGVKQNDAWFAGIAVFCWWLLAPIQVSTALYPIQRMTQLSALFSVAALISYLHARDAFAATKAFSGWLWLSFGFYGFALLAVLSKENGALVFLLAAACEWSFRYIKGNSSKKANVPVLLSIAVPLAMGAVYVVISFPGWINSYQIRDFSLFERLLTESRILLDYAYKIVFSQTAKMGLIHDDIIISRGLFQPVTTFLSFLFHFVIIGLAWLRRRRMPLFFLGILWFYAAHLMESSFIPLELYFEHRNYLPSLGLIIAISSILLLSHDKYAIPKRVAFVIFLVLAFAGTKQRAEIWGDPDRQIRIWAYEHPDSIRAQTIFMRYLVDKKRYSEAYNQLVANTKKWPATIHFDLVAVNLACSGVIAYRPPTEYLLEKMRIADYSSFQINELTSLAKAAKTNKCPEITNQLVHPMLEIFSQRAGFRRKARASIAFLNAELYIQERNLPASIDWLERTNDIYNDSIPLYLKSRVLASAGYMQEALVTIEEAIQVEKNKPPLKRKNLEAYKSYRETVKSALNKIINK